MIIFILKSRDTRFSGVFVASCRLENQSDEMCEMQFFYLSLVHSIISASQNRYKFVTAINILHHLLEYAVHPNVSHT